MEERKPFKIVSKKKSRYILPNALTLIGVCLGISSIKFSLDQNYSLAIVLLLFAALLDGLDGRVARLIDGASEFGKELDSLTDFVSFGIAPAFILYFWELKNYGKIGWAITLIFSVCCVLRLARFNLTKIGEEEKWRVNFFEGVPSPAGAGLVLLPLIYELSNFNIGIQARDISPYLAIFVSILLISKIPTFSFKKISIPRKLTIFLFLGIGIISIFLIFFTFETLLLIGLIYFLLIPVSFVSYRKNRSSNKTSPEDEHEDIL
jgi:CDP-diacylglycerol--serine O-phosphatidyltransferase